LKPSPCSGFPESMLLFPDQSPTCLAPRNVTSKHPPALLVFPRIIINPSGPREEKRSRQPRVVVISWLAWAAAPPSCSEDVRQQQRFHAYSRLNSSTDSHAHWRQRFRSRTLPTTAMHGCLHINVLISARPHHHAPDPLPGQPASVLCTYVCICTFAYPFTTTYGAKPQQRLLRPPPPPNGGKPPRFAATQRRGITHYQPCPPTAVDRMDNRRRS
jgi:hypothetical protein